MFYAPKMAKKLNLFSWEFYVTDQCMVGQSFVVEVE